ncbi:MAG: tetratricopeptide repeat protein [Armatimonadota bacterium]
MTNTETGAARHEDPGKALLEWFNTHRRLAYAGAAVLAALAFSIWFYISYRENVAERAERELTQARQAAQAGNLALAASDLSRLVNQYGGTIAADEATLLLGQVRLIQDQPTLAAEELRRAIERGVDDQFRAPAWGLLATALENVGNMSDAADAYERAAREAWYDFLAAEYLNDAGRAHVGARDTAAAVATYERLLDRYDDAPAALEARVRLAELQASRQQPPG